MPTLLLEREKTEEEESVPTKTDPKLQRTPKRLKTGGASQDNSITVIENPSVDGHIGYLFAQRFLETSHSRRFERTLYLRVDLEDFRIQDKNEYFEVRFDQGFDPKRLAYDFMIADGRIVLPRPSTVPYEICFIDPDLYNKYLADLKRSETVGPILEQVNSTLAKRAKNFRVDSVSKALILPQNYATLEI